MPPLLTRIVSNPHVKRFFWYTLLGGIGTGTHYFIFVLLVNYANLGPKYATMMSFTVGVSINYVLNYTYTFKSNHAHHVTLSKFFVVAVMGFFLNVGVVWLTVDGLNWHYLIGQFAATAIVLFWSFGINCVWTFKEGPQGHQQ
jgi:putative flippase GtrA